ncbi:MAG: mycofactocin biosynthesis chaperone MftB [Desulfobacterales bacterium]
MQQFQNPESDIQNLKSISEVCSSLKAPVGVPSHMGYKLADGVQVREEKFGLLFYNYRGPRLYFVPSKDLIDVDFFNGRQRISGLIASICARKGWTRARVGERIMQILAKLEDKGLIDGQSIC